MAGVREQATDVASGSRSIASKTPLVMACSTGRGEGVKKNQKKIKSKKHVSRLLSKAPKITGKIRMHMLYNGSYLSL